MLDSVFAGLVGGLFGPAIASWLSKFRYWAIFIAGMLSTEIIFIVYMLHKLGLEKTLKSFTNGIDPVFFFVPAGIGVLAVIIAFVGSAAVPKRENDYSEPDR